MPDQVLVVDLVHRIVRRIYEGEGGVGPANAGIRIVNLSVGDPAAPFTRSLSAWARLLDWAAWTHRALVVVSAGNHFGQIEVPYERAQVAAMSTDDIQKVTLGALADSIATRRLLPPAEAVNVLTVGACHADEAVLEHDGVRRELISSAWLPTPFSAVGAGFRRAIKPDVLMPGGRRLYELRPDDGPPAKLIGSDQRASPPGQLVASPAGPAGSIQGRAYSVGTSNAAALATRAAAQLHDLLHDTRRAGDAAFLDDDGVLVSCLRALLVHGASLGEGLELVSEALGDRVDNRRFREYASRYLGYGRCDPERLFGSTAQRVTMVGGGLLAADEADMFEIPLPPGLSGKVGQRRLVVTLAWLTPTNPRDRRYRRARLWYGTPGRELRVSREEADWRATRRGTVQHEVLTGSQATAFDDGDVVQIQVNCAAYAGNLEDEIPYGIAVTLEVAPEIEVDVFAEVRDRIRPLVTVRPPTA